MKYYEFLNLKINKLSFFVFYIEENWKLATHMKNNGFFNLKIMGKVKSVIVKLK